jgi:hypothetical protein
MKQVPLAERVIFSDWHSVLSRGPFRTSIRNSTPAAASAIRRRTPKL